MPDGDKSYAEKIRERLGNMYASLEEGLSFEKGCQCQKALRGGDSGFVLTEHPAWDSQGHLQLRAEIRSQEVKV